jgi:hypothetical protein
MNSTSAPSSRRDITRAVIEALEGSPYKWRTPRGIAKEIAVAEQRVFEILNRSDRVVRSKKPNRGGEPLFSSRGKYQASSTLAQRIISAITNEID